MSTDDYYLHIMKNGLCIAMNKLQNSSSPEKAVATMDLQIIHVLLSPKTEASVSHYKIRLHVHNSTIYSLNNGAVCLRNGRVSSNEPNVNIFLITLGRSHLQ